MPNRIKQDASIGENLKYLRKNIKIPQENTAAKLELIGLYISREKTMKNRK